MQRASFTRRLHSSASRNGELVDDLYEKYWREFDARAEPGVGVKEAKFWEKAERQGRLTSSRLDLLLFHYVGLQRREQLKVAHIFEEFKNWWKSEERKTGAELRRIPLHTLEAVDGNSAAVSLRSVTQECSTYSLEARESLVLSMG